MKKLGLLAAASFVLVACPQMALSKPSVLKIQPEGSQLAAMDSGAQVVTSQMTGSTVVMRAPEPFEGKRTRIFFTFVNNSQFPVNVGPENVTSTQVAVISYDQLIAEQKRSEGADKFFAAMGAVGKALSATDAGNQSTSTSYSGYVDCGIGCGGNYRGSAVSRTYSPYAAQQAQAQAAAENAAAASQMHSGHSSERNAIARNLQTTTVNSGHYITGMLTFEVPTAVRRGKKAAPITLAIRIGSDVHMLRGYAGPLGAPPPAPSSIAVGQVTQPLVSTVLPQTAAAKSAQAAPSKLRMLNLSNLFLDSDYPAGSMSRGDEGITAYELTVRQGRADYCRITSSSGYEELDSTTCRLAKERAVFDMSTLPKGDPQYFNHRVLWTIQAKAPRAVYDDITVLEGVSRVDLNKRRCLYSDGVVQFVNAGSSCVQAAAVPGKPANNAPSMLNAADLIKSSDYPAGSMSRGEVGFSGYKLTLNNGRPASCLITSSSGFEELDKATCRLATERSIFDMSTLPKGNWSTYSNRVKWTIGVSEPRAHDANLTATQSVSRVDPNRIRCQYSDGYVGFVNAGDPCIQAATLPAQQVSADLSATISKAILEGRCEDAKTVALTSSRLDLADLALRLCKPVAKQ